MEKTEKTPFVFGREVFFCWREIEGQTALLGECEFFSGFGFCGEFARIVVEKFLGKNMAYEKKFEEWGNEKKEIHNAEISVESSFYVNIREIWYIKMGVNIGGEIDGKKDFLRPVLILKKIGNMFFTVALTSKGKDNSFFYHKLENLDLQNPKYKESSYAVVSQLRAFDKKRFVEKIGTFPEKEFTELTKKLRKIIF